MPKDKKKMPQDTPVKEAPPWEQKTKPPVKEGKRGVVLKLNGLYFKNGPHKAPDDNNWAQVSEWTDNLKEAFIFFEPTYASKWIRYMPHHVDAFIVLETDNDIIIEEKYN